MGKNLNRHFSKENTEMANRCYKEVLNITNQYENANQNHKEISSHTCQDSYYLKKKKIVCIGEDVEK